MNHKQSVSGLHAVRGKFRCDPIVFPYIELLEVMTIPCEKNHLGVGSVTRPVLEMLLQWLWRRPWGLYFPLEPRSLLVGWGWGSSGMDSPWEPVRPATWAPRTHRRSDMRGGAALSRWCSGRFRLAAPGLPEFPGPTPDPPESGAPGLGQQPRGRGVRGLLTFANHRWTCSHCRGDGDTASDATRRCSQESPLLLCLRVCL